MPPFRPLVLDALAATLVAAALAVTVAGYVRNFPDTQTGYAARLDGWVDPITTGSIGPKTGSTDGTAAERPAASIADRVWTDPPRHAASTGGTTRDARDGAARDR